MHLIQNEQLVEVIAKVESSLLQLGAILLGFKVKIDERQAAYPRALQCQRRLPCLTRTQQAGSGRTGQCLK